jgi:beta-lactamase class A
MRNFLIALVFIFSTSLAFSSDFSSLENEYQGRLGIFAIDTSNQHTIEYKSKERFPFDSTFKVNLVGAILKKSEEDPRFLTQVVHYTQKDIDQSGYAPITAKHLKEGMTIEQLCAAAISYSDNAAANLLIKELGGISTVSEFARSLGDLSFRLDREEPDLNSNIPGDDRDTSTPKAMAEDLNKIVLGKVLVPEQQKLIQTWLRQNTTGNERIRAGVPINWTVGDKTGTGSRVMGDIAVLWPPHGSPIMLVIYFEKSKSDQPFNNKVMAEAARLAIQEL